MSGVCDRCSGSGKVRVAGHLVTCISCNGPERAAPDEPSPETMIVVAIDELAARWHRAAQEDDISSYDHNCGRREGYLQAIALLLGQPVADVRLALREGKL